MADLKNAALLVHVRTAQWTGVKQEPKIRQAAHTAHGVALPAMKGGQKLLLPEMRDDGAVVSRLAPLAALYGAASREHTERTLPWLDTGPRILSSAGYVDYMAAMHAHEETITAELERFTAWYHDDYFGNLAESRRLLNGLFDIRDYPTPAAMHKRFKFEVGVLPFPDEEDFRVDVGADELRRIREGIRRDIEAALEVAMGDVWRRVADVVGHMGERLRAYNPDKDANGGKITGKFHDTLLGNVRDLAALLPSLNVTHSAELAAIAELVNKQLTLPELGPVDVASDALRERPDLRIATAAAAEDIMAQMAAFV